MSRAVPSIAVPDRAGDAPAPSRLVPGLAAVVVGTLAVTLLTIGARSPYTHANLLPAFDRAYTRTEQITVGPPAPYLPETHSAGALTDSATSGATLLVVKGCASCHGLEGRGSAVGPAIAGRGPALGLEQVRAKTQKGPGGMPAYAAAALTDAELGAITTYLGSMVPDPAALPAPVAPSEPAQAGTAPAVAPTAPRPGGASFRADVEPVLLAQCVSCHKAAGKGGLSLLDHEAILRGGKSGPAVVPGDPEASLLVQKLRPVPPFGDRMPMDAVPLDEEVIARIAEWIRRGAPND